MARLANHFHLVLRSRPDVVAQWVDTEVARRWLMLCPLRKDAQGLPEEPTDFELNNDSEKPESVGGGSFAAERYFVVDAASEPEDRSAG